MTTKGDPQSQNIIYQWHQDVGQHTRYKPSKNKNEFPLIRWGEYNARHDPPNTTVIQQRDKTTEIMQRVVTNLHKDRLLHSFKFRVVRREIQNMQWPICRNNLLGSYLTTARMRLTTVYTDQGPVVQSTASLTSSFEVKMLTALVSTVSNLLLFLMKKVWVAFANAKATHIFSAKILAYMP